MSEIEIIPAIDLKDGRCVRLYQGDYAKETVFSDDPLDVALKWQSLGAPRLHIVDLDGAAAGEPRNLEIVKTIASGLLIPIQLGGGIRTLETVETLLKLGVDRVILGTVAVEDHNLVAEACRRFRESIVVSIDAREGHVATHGWRQGTKVETLELIRSLVPLGVRRFIYTDIVRDGTLNGPDFASLTAVIEAIKLPVIAAGGISSLDHLKVLKKLGVEGAIVGKALYTGDIDLKQALGALDEMG